MKFTASLIVAFAAASVSAISRCGDPTPPESLISALNETDLSSPLKRRNIDTYVHVVTTAAKEGMYPQSIVNAQMDAMNAAYGSSGFGFNLRATTFTVNDNWARALAGTQAEIIMKRQLRLGTYSDLNLYFLSDLGGGLLGFCYFPVPDPTQTDLVLDGCINLAGSMPGADEFPEYNLGYTAVHETGHWLGLFHVFQGSSCNGRGDYIPDTPVQKTPTSGCPAKKNSCKNKPGPDSIHNFMDYSYDACMYEFTPKQAQRATAVYDIYRAGK